MRKRSLRMIAVGTAVTLLLGGCGSLQGLMPGNEAPAAPVESSVPEKVIDPEEQARMDLLDSLEDVQIPTTTQTNRKDNSSESSVSDEYSQAENNGEEDDGESTGARIPGAWLNDDETRQELISNDGHIQIAVPLSWRDLSGQLTNDDEVNQSFNLQLGDTDQAVYFMANSESRRYSPFMSLDEYSSAIVAAVYNTMNGKEAFSDAELLSTVDMNSEVNDFVIRKSTLRAGYEGNPIYYYVYAVQGAYRYFQFNCWTAEMQKDTAEPLFDEIVLRFYEQ